MKIKLLVKLGELILGKCFSDDEPRADMYLPIKLLAFSVVLLVLGIAAVIIWLTKLTATPAILAVVFILLGVAAMLCWKNQTIQIVSDDSFVYTTFLGNKKEYSFSDIKGLKRNNDSLTLLVANDKVHIESMAIMSKRLIECINAQFQVEG